MIIEINPKEKKLFYSALVYYQNKLVRDISTKKKNKIKYKLKDDENELKDVRNLIHIFEK